MVVSLESGGWVVQSREQDRLCEPQAASPVVQAAPLPAQFSDSVISDDWCAVAQSCPTLCNPVDGSPPGSSVHGILQARILEWVAISFTRGSS